MIHRLFLKAKAVCVNLFILTLCSTLVLILICDVWISDFFSIFPTPMFSFVGGCVLVLIVLVLYYFIYRPLVWRRFFVSQGIPFDPFVPFVGNLPSALTDLSRVSPPFLERSRWNLLNLGPVWGSFHGPVGHLIVASPYYIADVLGSKSFAYFKSVVARDLLVPFMGNGLTMSEGDLWKQQVFFSCLVV